MPSPFTLVTGASGHIGANLTRALVAAGQRVRVLFRGDDRALTGLDVERVAGDVRDPDAMRRAAQGAEVVYHLAAHISISGDPDGSVHRTNVLGTGNVVDACLRAGVRRLVHFSSIHALSPLPAGQPLDETRGPADGDPTAPAYDRSKAAGEREVLKGVGRGLDAVIVNPAGVLGPHDYAPSRMGEVLLLMYQRRLPALVRGGFDWVDARDVATAAMAAAERGRRGERYLLSGHWHSIPELAAMVHAATGSRPPRLSVPLWVAGLGAPVAPAFYRLLGQRPLFTTEALHAMRCYQRGCCDKARRELGYDPRPISQTIADTFDWLRAAGRI